MNSPQLFQRAENGDVTSQGELFQYYYPLAYRLAFTLLNQREDAEEVAQDALAYALLNLRKFDSVRGTFTNWVYTITVSRCRNKRRRKHLAELPLLGWLVNEKKQTGTPMNPPEHTLEHHQRHIAITAAISQLPDKQREAIILRYYHDCDYAQIGEIVGCSPSTAQSRVWLAQKRLYGLLTQEMGESNLFKQTR